MSWEFFHDFQQFSARKEKPKVIAKSPEKLKVFRPEILHLSFIDFRSFSAETVSYTLTWESPQYALRLLIVYLKVSL
jgi:hypothetical protein